MTVEDLIRDTDFPYIEWKVRMPQEMRLGDVFFGACKSCGGTLIPLDADSIYCVKETALKAEKRNDKLGRECLTVVVPYRET